MFANNGEDIYLYAEMFTYESLIIELRLLNNELFVIVLVHIKLASFADRNNFFRKYTRVIILSRCSTARNYNQPFEVVASLSLSTIFSLFL